MNARRLPEVAKLPRDAQARVHRAVLFGERLERPRERRAAVAVARQWREHPLRTGAPMLVGVLGVLAVAWGAAQLFRPAWLSALTTAGGAAGSLLGVLAGFAIMLMLQRFMAGRAERRNSAPVRSARGRSRPRGPATTTGRKGRATGRRR